MKTLLAIASIAAFVAFVFSPLSFELSAGLLFAAGFVTVVFQDYSRSTVGMRPSLSATLRVPSRRRVARPALPLAA